jgi:hypothetical protein
LVLPEKKRESEQRASRNRNRKTNSGLNVNKLGSVNLRSNRKKSRKKGKDKNTGTSHKKM